MSEPLTPEEAHQRLVEIECRRLNKELRIHKDLPEDWHEKNSSTRMKRTNNGYYG